MRDKADLTDKADELEHLVLQLEGETATIGEHQADYITPSTDESYL